MHTHPFSGAVHCSQQSVVNNLNLAHMYEMDIFVRNCSKFESAAYYLCESKRNVVSIFDNCAIFIDKVVLKYPKRMKSHLMSTNILAGDINIYYTTENLDKIATEKE